MRGGVAERERTRRHALKLALFSRFIDGFPASARQNTIVMMWVCTNIGLAVARATAFSFYENENELLRFE